MSKMNIHSDIFEARDFPSSQETEDIAKGIESVLKNDPSILEKKQQAEAALQEFLNSQEPLGTKFSDLLEKHRQILYEGESLDVAYTEVLIRQRGDHGPQ